MEVTDEQLAELETQMSNLYGGARVVQNARSKCWSICRPSTRRDAVNEWVFLVNERRPIWSSKIVWTDKRTALIEFMIFPENYKWRSVR